MSSPDPDELLRQLDPGIAELKAKAELAQEQLASSSATTRSSDGSVSVTVGPGGNLTGLNLTERAYQRPPRQLAAQIMQLAAQAQQQVSAQVMAAFGGLVGADSPAMSVLSPFLPPEPSEGEPETPAPHPDEPFDAHPGGYGPPSAPDAYPSPPAQGPPQPPAGSGERRPRRRRGDEQEVEPDYDEGDLWT